MARTKVPAIEGWMNTPPLDELPENDGTGIPGVTLIGTRCVDSGTYFFPPERVMSRAPGHAGSELVEVELSTSGTLWSYTDAQYQPPIPYVAPTDPYVPYCLAAVELAEEKMVVLGQVIAGIGVDDLRVGMEMELVLDTLNVDDDHEYMIWKWRPVSTTASETSGASS